HRDPAHRGVDVALDEVEDRRLVGRRGADRGQAVGAAQDDVHDAAEEQHPPEEGHVTDGEIDLAEQQDKDLGHGQDHVDGALLEEVHQVARAQKGVLGGGDLEDGGDGHQADNDGDDPAVAAPDPQPPAPQVLTQGLGGELGRLGKSDLPGRRQGRFRLGDDGHRRLRFRDRRVVLDGCHGYACLPFTVADRPSDRPEPPVVMYSTVLCRSKPDAGPSTTIRPRWSTAIRSATSKMSLRLCEITITASPRSRSRRTRSSTIRVWTTPRAAVGSSKSTTLEFHITALATATDWRWPPES